VRRKNGHAGPPPVVDGTLQGDEGFGVRFGVDDFLRPIPAVCPRTTFLGSIRTVRKTCFFSSMTAPAQRAVGAQSHESKNLEQMGHHHVAKPRRALIEAGTFAEARVSGHIDLPHMGD